MFAPVPMDQRLKLFRPLFEATGIAPTARAEELSVEQFCALARQVAAASSD